MSIDAEFYAESKYGIIFLLYEMLILNVYIFKRVLYISRDIFEFPFHSNYGSPVNRATILVLLQETFEKKVTLMTVFIKISIFFHVV